MNVGPIDFVDIAACNADLRDIENDRFKLLDRKITRKPNIDTTGARWGFNMRLK